MKTIVSLSLAAALMIPLFAQAETRSVKVTTGEKAERMYNSMRAQARNAGATMTTSNKVKVVRSRDGLEQLACYRSSHHQGGSISFRCREERSLNGRKLPEVNTFPNPR